MTLLIVAMRNPACTAGEAADATGRTPTVDAISAGVSEQDPRSVDLRPAFAKCGLVTRRRERWEQGVLQMCPREAVRDGHSVLLVGFRDNPAQPGGGAFLIRNTGGDGRDGWMSYEYVQTYMNDAVWIGCEGAARHEPPGCPAVRISSHSAFSIPYSVFPLHLDFERGAVHGNEDKRSGSTTVRRTLIRRHTAPG